MVTGYARYKNERVKNEIKGKKGYKAKRVKEKKGLKGKMVKIVQKSKMVKIAEKS